jgi:hypothetical protein
VLDWWPEMKEATDLERLLREEQADAFHRWEAWSWWTRITYNFGILAFLGGLALALPPQHGSHGQDDLRWVAAGVAFAACGGEVVWIGAAAWRRSLEARQTAKISEKELRQ